MTTFTAEEWAVRDGRCERITELALEILEPKHGDRAVWYVTGWDHDLAPGVRQCREYLDVHADPDRVRRLHDACSAGRLISSVAGIGDRTVFTPRIGSPE